MNHSIVVAQTLFSWIIRDNIQKPVTVPELLEMHPNLKQKYPNCTTKGVGRVLTRYAAQYSKQARTVACGRYAGANHYWVSGAEVLV